MGAISIFGRETSYRMKLEDYDRKYPKLMTSKCIDCSCCDENAAGRALMKLKKASR